MKSLFRYLGTAWRFISGKNCASCPHSAPFSLNLALKANLKSQTGNDASSERPRSFHHHFPIKSNTWGDCQVKLSPHKKIFPLSENGLLLSKQIRRHCLVLVQTRLQLGFPRQWDTGLTWSFVGTIRGTGIAEPESKRNPEII